MFTKIACYFYKSTVKTQVLASVVLDIPGHRKPARIPQNPQLMRLRRREWWEPRPDYGCLKVLLFNLAVAAIVIGAVIANGCQ